MVSRRSRNGAEICDDEHLVVDAPGTNLVLVCPSDAGGVIYVAENTGPPDPGDVPGSVHRSRAELPLHGLVRYDARP